MKKMLSYNYWFFTKIIFQAGLLFIFLYYFGIPSVERYMSDEVLTITSETYPDKIPLPAVTVSAFNTSEAHDDWSAVCGGSEDLAACAREKTHSLAETIHAELGVELRESLMAPELWRGDFSVPYYGRSYTLLYPHLKGNNWRTDSINLLVNTSDGLTRRIFIHDPDYFVYNVIPAALPMTVLSQPPRSGRLYYSLALTEHRKLNTQHNPCEEDQAYSFTACVKESLSETIGCRLLGDKLSDQTRPDCDTLEQFQTAFAHFYYLLLASSRKIFTKTGCQKPCRYREYVVMEGPVEADGVDNSYFSVGLWMVSTDITLLTEIPVYPWTSLLAEFGGAVGLFFGLSMMTLWDGMRRMADVVNKRFI